MLAYYKRLGKVELSVKKITKMFAVWRDDWHACLIDGWSIENDSVRHVLRIAV